VFVLDKYEQVRTIVADAYADWLLEKCPEDVRNSDEHIEKQQEGHRWDEFTEFMGWT